MYPVTYPSTQRGWIEFSIAVFDELLRKPNVRLFEGGPADSDDSLLVMECFPTSAWRSSGLTALPGKKRSPELNSYAEALIRAFELPSFSVHSHDDLQAVVAALCAAGAVGGPCAALPRGVEAGRDSAGRRTEGVIWDALPSTGPVAAVVGQPRATATARAGADVAVTTKVLEQVNRTNDPSQAQIAIRGVDGGTKANRVRTRLRVDEVSYDLVIGDSHAIWPSHQTVETRADFQLLFAKLSEVPGDRVPIDEAGAVDAGE